MASIFLTSAYNLGLQSQFAYKLTVLATLLRGSRRCQFNILHPKSVQRLCNLDLGLRIEKRIGELLSLAQRGFNDREIGDCMVS